MADLYIFDGFYNNVDEVREGALNMEFGVRGNYPGQRTVPVNTTNIQNFLAEQMRTAHGEITYWPNGEYTGAYQYTTSRDRSWIHADQTTMWAGVLYLTPNAPHTGGTGLFRHKETGLESAPRLENGEIDHDLLDYIYQDSQDLTKWDLMDVVGNKYNRLVIYRGDYFHMSLDYFGRDQYDGRLFQTFFFSTEY